MLIFLFTFKQIFDICLSNLRLFSIAILKNVLLLFSQTISSCNIDNVYFYVSFVYVGVKE